VDNLLDVVAVPVKDFVSINGKLAEKSAVTFNVWLSKVLVAVGG
jgi:hypothetical protein